MRLGFPLTIAAAGLLTLAAGAAAQQPSPISRPGQGVTSPTVVREVKPAYTEAAKKEKIQGTVLMDVVVQSDGSVGDIAVTRSVDKTYGLDDEAIKAMKQWTFNPGKKDGKAVPVLVEVEMSFTLK
jgi:TonB family protein